MMIMSRTLFVLSIFGIRTGLSVPLHRRDVPALGNTLEATYTPASSGLSGGRVTGPVVNLSAKTSVPSLNLDKLPFVSGVTCDEDAGLVTVTFTSDIASSDVSKSWASSSEYLLLVNPTFCDTSRAEWKIASSFSNVVETNSIRFAGVADAPNISDTYLTNYNITISGIDLEQPAAAPASNFSNGYGDENRRLQRRGELKVKFGPTAADAAPLKLSDNIAMACRGCSIEATARMDIKLTKEGAKPKLKVDTSGSFKAAVGLYTVVSVSSSQLGVAIPSASVPLVSIPLSPFSIAGVVTLGPQFDITLSAGINSVSGSAAFNGGFDVVSESGATYATKMDDGTNDGTGTFTPPIKLRPISFESAKISVSGSVSLVPAFKVGVVAFGKDIVTTGVKLINKVSMNAAMGVSLADSSGPACGNGLQVGAKFSSTVGANIGPLEKNDLLTLASADIFSTCIAF